MLVPLAFWSFLFGALAIGWQAGDASDRKMMVCVALAAAATYAASGIADQFDRRLVVRAIDFALLAVFVKFSLSTTRFWPIWFSGILGATVFLGLIGLLLHDESEARAFFIASSGWAMPSLIVLAVGLQLDRRAGVFDTPLSTRGAKQKN